MEKTKTSRKKKPTAIKIIRNFGGLIIILAIFCAITWNQITSYFTPIFYEYNIGVSSKADSSNKLAPPDNRVYIKIRVQTRSAFIPFEKVKISVLLTVTDSDLINKMQHGNNLFQVFGGHLTNNAMNKEILEKQSVFNPSNEKSNSFTEQVRLIAKYSVGNGMAELHPTENLNEYYGECEVMFYNQGKYDVDITLSAFYQPTFLPLNDYKIEIGSSVDSMNKRTNDLLFTLTVLNLFLWIYTEIKSGLKNMTLEKKG